MIFFHPGHLYSKPPPVSAPLPLLFIFSHFCSHFWVWIAIFTIVHHKEKEIGQSSTITMNYVNTKHILSLWASIVSLFFQPHPTPPPPPLPLIIINYYNYYPPVLPTPPIIRDSRVILFPFLFKSFVVDMAFLLNFLKFRQLSLLVCLLKAHMKLNGWK